jgi:hypothetical protein
MTLLRRKRRKQESKRGHEERSKQAEYTEEGIHLPTTQSLGKQGQTANFETVKDYVIDHIQRTFKYPQDVAASLEQAAPINIALPVLSQSIKTRDEKTSEQ